MNRLFAAALWALLLPSLALAQLSPQMGAPTFTDPAQTRLNLGLGTASILPSTAFDAAGLATAEANRATAAEAVVAASVTAEVSRALIAEGVNATAITTETTARIAAVNGEATARVAGDTANTSAISTEASTARGAEGTLTTAVAAEVANRGTAVTGEATARAAADTTNANAITSEASTARTAEGANATAITTEATTARNAANLSSGTLPAARLPNPAATTLGGVESLTAPSHQFLTGITTGGVPQAAQPASGDVSGLAASATTDTTNASNITSGTLPAARLPTAAITGGTISGADVSGAVSTTTGGTTTRTLATRAADVFNPRDYGAIGDGTSHPAGSALGISTLSALAGYAAPNGTHPYAWVSSYPHGTLFNLPVSQASTVGATTLNFGVTKTVNLVLPLTAATASGNNVLTFASLYSNYPGVPVSASNGCIPSATTVNSTFNTQLIMTANSTCGMPIGTLITFAMPSVPTPISTQPLPSQSTATLVGGTTMEVVANLSPGLATLPANSLMLGANIPAGTTACSSILNPGGALGTITLCSAISVAVTAFNPVALYAGWSLYMTDVAGIYQGMTVAGLTGVSGTVWVEHVNPSTNEVRLSKPVGGQSGVSLTFSWPKTLAAGTQVSGPGVPGGTTVVSNTSGVVTLSAAMTAATASATSNSATTPVARGTPITFFAPFTDSQATALQMDALGLIAAEQAGEAAGGGAVVTPGGHYLIDQTVIFPVFGLGATRTPIVSLAGAGERQTFFDALSDRGRDNYILSCGDPTAAPENGRGIYGGSGAGAYCDGHWRDFHVETLAYSGVTAGVRPTIAGVPVAMGGLRSGPRREMDNLYVEGFNVGIEGQSDHTRLNLVTSIGNFMGYRLGPAMTQLFGDNNFDHVFFYGNTWAGISIDPNSYWNGVMVKPYLGFNPYAIWCEPGAPTVGVCIQGSRIIEPNWESQGCAMVKDGNISPGVLAFSASRILSNVTIDSLFTSSGAGYILQGGCSWTSYIDMMSAYGVRIENIPANAFPVVGGAVSIIRLHRAANFFANQGGLVLSGAGVYSILQAYGASCQEIVTGGGGTSSDFWFTFADRQVMIEQQGEFTAKPIALTDAGATTLPLGTLMESAFSTPRINAQRAGTASAGTAIVEGVSMQPFACNMNNKFVVVGTSGRELPIKVPSAQTAGTLLKVGTAGVAAAATSVTDGQGIGIVVDSNSGSAAQVFMQATFPGGL